MTVPLTELMERVMAALEPFAHEAERFRGSENELYRWKPDKHSRISTGDFTRARDAYELLRAQTARGPG